MSNKNKSVYKKILEISKLAEEMEFEDKKNLKPEENEIKKVINRPVTYKNYPYEAYKKYFSDKKD